ncbi:MAG: S-layer homology domain-containing protein [Acidimicrobiia bacterium]|nr:S-layer homology domain-containing protein [Acidimicrobiia bacterium]
MSGTDDGSRGRTARRTTPDRAARHHHGGGRAGDRDVAGVGGRRGPAERSVGRVPRRGQRQPLPRRHRLDGRPGDHRGVPRRHLPPQRPRHPPSHGRLPPPPLERPRRRRPRPHRRPRLPRRHRHQPLRPRHRLAGRPGDHRGYVRRHLPPQRPRHPPSHGRLPPPPPGTPSAPKTPTPSPTTHYPDVTDTNPFDPDIAWLADLEITQGYPDGTYRPNDPVTRQAMAAFLHRLWNALDPVVDTAADSPDADPGDGTCADVDTGSCSLRAAIDETNAAPGHDTIRIADGVDPTLTIAGTGEDANATGDLDVTGDLTLWGNGATVDADGLDRVLDVRADVTAVTGLTVTGGSTVEFGGGLRHTDGDLDLVEIRATGNEAHHGGGIAARSAGRLTLERATVDHNTATPDPESCTLVDGLGGGIYQDGWTTSPAGEVVEGES